MVEGSNFRPDFVKRLFLTLAENSYTPNFMRNLNFIFVQKFMGDYLQEEVDKSIQDKYVGRQ
jgi:hypothetical protein